MPRRALLLGVDNYADPGLFLSSPKHDVAALAAALAQGGYPKAGIQTSLSSVTPLSTATMRHTIRKFLRECEAGDELLVYFSGHGAEQEQSRLLIPQDYYLEEPRPAHELIGDERLYAMARDCPARSVLFVIDACRDGVKLTLTEDKGGGGARGTDAPPPAHATPTVAMLFSCAHGELSHAVKDSLSFFTSAMCGVLEGDDERATLGEVLDATRTALASAVSGAGLSPQTASLDERPIVGRGGPVHLLAVKENASARIRQGIHDSAWCSDLRGHSMWRSLSEALPALADQVLVLVFRAEQLVMEATRLLPLQRWRDPGAPLQVVHYLEMLCPGETLPSPSAALAMATPFVYEAVLAAGEILLAHAGDPLSPLTKPGKSDDGRPWLALRNAVAAQEALTRRCRLLAEHGKQAASEDLAALQMLRFLHTSGELWEHSPARGGGWASEHLATFFDPLGTVAANDRIRKLMSGSRLMRFARLLFAPFEDIELERNRSLFPELRLGEYPDSWVVDECALAHLVSLAATMASDPRRLSPLMAEHLGMVDSINAAALTALLNQSEWHRVGSALSLTMETPHEVIDAVLEEVAIAAEAHRSRLARAGCLCGLPERFDASGLHPAVNSDGQPLFQKPHLRLTLNESRVRELLMGRNLYGEPSLALREMYQNALDACRHRRARVRWLQATGNTQVEPYAATIAFKAGKTRRGRAYIECRDNGIGMAERHLRRLFARAGQRFTDSHEFHLEKARWDEEGIDFFQNSRFGIGVYSYFMLADEILVETKRLHENGIDHEPGISASVVGSGSLFRLQAATAVPVGTKVRLYLNDGDRLDELLAGITGWLWIPEFDTRIEYPDGDMREFPAREPTEGMLRAQVSFLKIDSAVDSAKVPRLFWSLERTARGGRRGREDLHSDILCDGILTDGEGIPGVLVNLTEDLRPELSVDRSRVTDWSAGRSSALRTIAAEAWKYLPLYPEIDLCKLDALFAYYPGELIELDLSLRAGRMADVRLPLHTLRAPKSISMANLGISPFDAGLLGMLGDKATFLDLDLSIKSYCASFQLGAASRRLSALAAAGQPMPPALEQLVRFEGSGGDLPDCCVRMVGRLVRAPDGRLVLPSLALLQLAQEWRLTLGRIFALAQPLSKHGVAIAELPSDLHDYARTPSFAYSLDLDADAIPEFTGIPVQISFASMLTALRIIPDERMKEAWDDLQVVRAFNVTLPVDRLEDFIELVADPRLLEFMSRDLDGAFPWIDRCTVSHLLRASHSKDMTLGEIWSLAAAPLGKVGFELPGLPGHLQEFRIGSLAAKFLPDEFEEVGTERVTLGALIRVCEDDSIPWEAALAALEPLGELGFEIPDPAGARSCVDGRAEIARLLSRDLDGLDPFLDRIPLRHLIAYAADKAIPLGEALALARRLASFGVPICDVPKASIAFVPSETHAQLLGKGRGEGDDLMDVEWTRCLDVMLKLSDSGFAKLVEPLRALGFSIQVPSADAVPLLSHLKQQASYSDVPGRRISPLELASHCCVARTDPGQYVDALASLLAAGWEVEEALAFARFCVDSRDGKG